MMAVRANDLASSQHIIQVDLMVGRLKSTIHLEIVAIKPFSAPNFAGRLWPILAAITCLNPVSTLLILCALAKC